MRNDARQRVTDAVTDAVLARAQDLVRGEPTEPTMDENGLLASAVDDVLALMYAAQANVSPVVIRALLDAAGTRITEVLYP